MKSTVCVLSVMAVLMVSAGVSRAGSIYARASHRTKSLLTDDTARQIGDVLTIVIAEKSKIESETSRKMDKTTSRSTKMSGTADGGSLTGGLGKNVFALPKIDVSAAYGNGFDGEADYDTDRRIADQITVVVHDVLPNGNLVVVGRRTRNVAGDVQTIEVSGIVRPTDVTFGNSVVSSRVANFRVVHKTSGHEPRFTKPGWLGRIANMLSLF